MKKLCLLLIAMVTLALFIGCAGTPAASSAPAPAPAQPAVATSTVPAWFMDMPPVDEIWGIGIARISDPSLAMETATTRAQRDAARQLGAVVQGMLTDYTNSSGLSENPRVMQSIENVGRNVVNMTLQSTVSARGQGSDGAWYVRVAVKKADATRQVESLVDNEFADYAEFRRTNALAALDSAIIKGEGNED